MRIAYISYEYPPDTAFGGIARYVYQASQLMLKRGHLVEVFTATHGPTKSELFDNIHVHRVQCVDRKMFSKAILPVFEARAGKVLFEVMESPEFSGDSLEIKKEFPEIALVVKLHAPWFLIHRISQDNPKRVDKIKGYIKEVLFRSPEYQKDNDKDYTITALANEIQSPSVALIKIISGKWEIPQSKIFCLPNIYVPSEKLLNIAPISAPIKGILFLGRLQSGKGILELCEAIPPILKRYPDLKFLFVGKPMSSPKRGLNMKDYINKKYKRYTENMEFFEMSYDKIHEVFERIQICVLPSLWDNFPYACLEAMAGAKAIIASREGGMFDMIADAKAGILVDPKKPKEISEALRYYLENPEEARKRGERAREKVLTAYNGEVIGKVMEERYAQAIYKTRNKMSEGTS